MLLTTLLDSTVHLDVPAELRVLLEPLLPGATHDQPTVRLRAERTSTGYVVDDGAARRVAEGAAAAVGLLLEACNRAVLAGCHDVAVHAGVVARAERAVAVPAASGGGKTTLVSALLRAGWEYVSDEALVLAADGGVRSYPKWLSVHSWTLDRLGLPPASAGRQERPVAPTELGRTAAPPLVLAHVLLVERVPGSPPALLPAGRAGAAAELLRCAFNHYRDPAGSLSRVAGAVAGAQAWHLRVDDPVAAAELLTEELG